MGKINVYGRSELLRREHKQSTDQESEEAVVGMFRSADISI